MTRPTLGRLFGSNRDPRRRTQRKRRFQLALEPLGASPRSGLVFGIETE